MKPVTSDSTRATSMVERELVCFRIIAHLIGSSRRAVREEFALPRSVTLEQTTIGGAQPRGKARAPLDRGALNRVLFRYRREIATGPERRCSLGPRTRWQWPRNAPISDPLSLLRGTSGC